MSDQLRDAGAQAWFASHTCSTGSEDTAELAATKRALGLRISVCIPALNEASTIGPICEVIARTLMGPQGLVDELIVVDPGSTDGTGQVAMAAGATVVSRHAALNEVAPGAGGKGAALWSSLASATGDIVVWLDADTKNFSAHFVTGLVAPLLHDANLRLVKAFYERPLVAGENLSAAEGGRVTELVVRPMLNLFYPSLAGVIQPLAGECAVRRADVMQLPFVGGYGVEVALLIDVVERWGLGAVAQADLGVRIHRNRDLLELGQMSFEILRTMMGRFEDLGLLKAVDPPQDSFAQFRDGQLSVIASSELVEIPPLASVL
ncbi:MAG: glucosyl-3-phosphoglycerate synthase [Actinomycetota bacterium]|nr:glucosyl-3-phosphoglycerate synthase [Actinomycetota bacterium]